MSTYPARPVSILEHDQRREIEEFLPALNVAARRFYRSESEADALVIETIASGQLRSARLPEGRALKLSLFRIMHRFFLDDLTGG